MQFFNTKEQRHRDIWGWPRMTAALLAALIVKASQLGRLIGHIARQAAASDHA